MEAYDKNANYATYCDLQDAIESAVKDPNFSQMRSVQQNVQYAEELLEEKKGEVAKQADKDYFARYNSDPEFRDFADSVVTKVPPYLGQDEVVNLCRRIVYTFKS